MGDMLSQAEIDALLNGTGGGDDSSEVSEPTSTHEPERILTDEERDILGEIGNISMGTSATTLYALLNQKVMITTPVVSLIRWKELAKGHDRPCVGIRVDYTEGIQGSNVLVLKQSDVKIISNLMMGGDGKINEEEPLSELDLSAISEAMNQMIGSASTSLSSLVKMRIDIDTPHAFILDFSDDSFLDDIGFDEEIVVSVAFRMEIGDLIDSVIMQVLPLKFAISMVDIMKEEMFSAVTSSPAPTPAVEVAPPQAQQQAPPQTQPQSPIPPAYEQPQQMQQQQMYVDPNQQMYQQQMYQQQMYQQQMYQQQMYQQAPPQGSPPPAQQQAPPQGSPPPPPQQQYINAQPALFQSFDMASDVMQQKENIGIIMDVPLDVTVELGRTSKKIKEILEFSPGSIIELDKLAGEPIDILVNGKFVAKGEVLVIDENFGIRITDIINVEHRI